MERFVLMCMQNKLIHGFFNMPQFTPAIRQSTTPTYMHMKTKSSTTLSSLYAKPIASSDTCDIFGKRHIRQALWFPSMGTCAPYLGRRRVGEAPY